MAIKSARSFLDGIGSLIRKPTGTTSKAVSSTSSDKFHSSTQNLSAALEDLQSTIEKQKEELAKLELSKISSGIDSASKGAAERSLESRQKELESAIEKMHSSIFALHADLQSGLTQQNLDELEKFGSDLLAITQGNDLDSRIRAAITEDLQRRISPLAWKIFMQALEKAGVGWPEPGGLIPGASADQRERVIQHRIMEAEQTFLHQNFQRGVENMSGIVSAWKSYPDPKSWLWQEVMLSAVACGIRCSIMQAAVEKLRSEGESLRAKAAELIDQSMTEIQGVLQAGVRSIDEAEQLVSGVDNVVKELLPNLAWNQAKSSVDEQISRMLKSL